MNKTEKPIERALRDGVKKRGGVAIKLWPFSQAGLPDRLVLLPVGRVYFVETKAPGKRPRPEQTIVHGRLRAMGFVVEVLDTLEGVQEFLKSV